MEGVFLLMGPILRLEGNLIEFSLSGVGLGLKIVVPTDKWRERHKDGFGASFGLEAEECAAIINEVELDVAPASVELKLALCFGRGQVLTSFDNRPVGGNEVVADRTKKSKGRFEAALIVVVEENATDASSFVSVWEVEVFVAGFLEAWVELFAKWIAGSFGCVVPVRSVFPIAVVGSEIEPTAKPPDGVASFRLGMKEAHIHMGSRYIRIPRVNY